jgi:flavin-binding protein dodecin
MARVVKIVELMGVSDKSFSDAVRQAVKEASKTIRNITGVEVIKSTAEVEDDEIFEYHVTVRLAFAIERGKSAATAGESSEADEERPEDEGDDEREQRDDEEREPRDEEDEEPEPRDEEVEEPEPRGDGKRKQRDEDER